jgi:hypothetical protein
MLYADPMERDALRDFIERHSRLFILTGAGCSTDSGIPDYRDAEGGWKRAQPVQFRAFMDDEATRKRYWARSLVGWRRFGRARPNDAHWALAALEQRGGVVLLVTQNVDRLHQAAGSTNVVDLHGRLDHVRCMGCERRMPREELQRELLARNPSWTHHDAREAPVSKFLHLRGGPSPKHMYSDAYPRMSGSQPPDVHHPNTLSFQGIPDPSVVGSAPDTPPISSQPALEGLNLLTISTSQLQALHTGGGSYNPTPVSDAPGLFERTTDGG